MKSLGKFILLMAFAMSAASCSMGDGSMYTNKYTMYADFEYSNVFGSLDSVYFDRQQGAGIGYQDMAFYHKLNSDGEFQGGFALSRLKGSGNSGQDRFRVCSGAGSGTSASYLVYYATPNVSLMPKTDIEFVVSQYGTCSMVGCYMNNTKEVLNAIKNTFVDGDRLAVKMTGYLGGEKTGEQEFVLAEYTEQKDSVVTTWSPFMLDKLGAVETVDIDIISTRPEIPTAFCLDLLIANIMISY